MTAVSSPLVCFLALCFFVISFMAFLSEDKTLEIKLFMALLLGLILRSIGLLMINLRAYAGAVFWFYESKLASLITAVLLYFFVDIFVGKGNRMLKLLWSAGTAIIVILTPFQWFIPSPTVTENVGGGIAIHYQTLWPAYIAYGFYLCIGLSILKLLIDAARGKGAGAPGLIYLILGYIFIVLGIIAGSLSASSFPWDMPAGIILTVLFFAALYKKNMLHIRPFILRFILLFFFGLLCVLISGYLVGPVSSFISSNLPVNTVLSNTGTLAAVIAVFSFFIGIVYSLISRYINTAFSMQGHQSLLLKSFSDIAARTLNLSKLMNELVNVISKELPVQQVYICFPENGGFVPCYSSEALNTPSFMLSSDSPCIKYLTECKPYVSISDFKQTPYYLSMWESEKELLRQLNLSAILAFMDQDDISGVILLSVKEQKGALNANQINFLMALSAIASMAIKNAILYEQVFREARIDSLTDVYNYKFFAEKLPLEFVTCKDDSIGLMYVDLDDFKLYNQLYGSVDGDYVLKEVAAIIKRCSGEGCSVFRISGKVFAVLLPHYDGREATALASEIQQQIARINDSVDRQDKNPITASYGICVSPYSASTTNELIENTNLAVYHAKTTGKSKIVMFKGITPTHQSISDRAMDIVERVKARNDSTYKTHSPTIFALTAAIDAKDHYTYNHSLNVARYASILATAAGLSEEQIGIIYEAALLHDVGKISVPEKVLSKTSSLTIEEFSMMRCHVNSSIDIIKHLPSMEYLIPAVVGHHERWDGKGYPQGISGEDIPITARCLAIADSFDAMTTNRPYRESLTVDYAARQIEGNAGTQFDPLLAHIFVELLQDSEIIPYQTTYEELPSSMSAMTQQTVG